ncbi:alpha/beta hydrolase [Aestuariirhabdus sp. LZHN29]|uniref:alpha/beta hydrolase n=1 Tax=Aestuariirhabdus sp. LZHN29 TaxID=3417462 RepID=UPI003CEEA7E5
MSASANQDWCQLLQQMGEQLRPLGLGQLSELSDVERRGLDRYGVLLSPQQVRQSVGYFEHQGQRIALYRFRPLQARGSCFLLHGYYDHVGLYGHLIRFLLGQGFEVVAIDLPGHGLSEGERASIKEFCHYRQLLGELVSNAARDGLPRPWVAMGQSTGAGILADFVLSADATSKAKAHSPFDQLVMLAPLLRPHRWPLARIAHCLLNPLIREIPRSYSRNSSDEAFLDFVRYRDPLQPRILPLAWVAALGRWIPRMLAASPSQCASLIVQGEADQTVDWRFNIPVYTRLFPAAKVLYLPQAGHHLANESVSLREYYLHWLSQNLINDGGVGADTKGYTRVQEDEIETVESFDAE